MNDSENIELSAVVPVYNEEESLPELCRQLHTALEQCGRPYEILLVDDGSSDESWPRMLELSKNYPCLRLFRLRRNFGQTAAMSAGFDNARGGIIVTLDADLQNDPADIPLLLEQMEENVDVVSGWRRERKDPLLSRRLPSRLANALISRITGVMLHDYGCTLKAYRRDVIKQVRLYGEMHRFIPALASWVGGEVREVPVGHRPRRHGVSKYGLTRTIRVILDLITVKFLLRYSMGPMQMFGKLGVFFGVPGLALLTVMVLMHLSFLVFGTTLGAEWIKRPFWIMTSFMLIFFGIQFVSIGLLAEVQTRTYHESQSKPVYVIRERHDSRDRASGSG